MTQNFEQAKNEDNTKHSLEYKLFYYQPKKTKAWMQSKIVLETKIKMFFY